MLIVASRPGKDIKLSPQICGPHEALKFPVSILELVSAQHFHMYCWVTSTKFFIFLHLVMSACKPNVYESNIWTDWTMW